MIKVCNGNKKFYITLLVLFVSIVMLSILWRNDCYLFNTDNPKTEKVTINGQYKLKDSDEICKLDSSTCVKLNGYDTVTVEGNFDRDIEKHKIIIMRIDNANVEIYDNDNLIYSLKGDPKEHFSRSPGNGWVSFESPGITKNDHIKIKFSNVYLNHRNSTFNKFKDNIFIGSDGNVVAKNIHERLYNNIVVSIIIGIGVIIGTFVLCMPGEKRKNKNLIYLSSMLIVMGIWFFIDFETQNVIINKPVFNNSLDITVMLFAMYFFAFYFSTLSKGIWTKLLKILGISSLGISLLAAITQFLRIADYYDYVFIIEIVCIMLVVCIFCGVTYSYYIDRSYDNEKNIISTYILLLGTLIDVIFNMCGITPSIIWFETSFFIFTIIQIILNSKLMKSQIVDNIKEEVIQKMKEKDIMTSMNNKECYLKTLTKLDKEIKINNNLRFSVIVFYVYNLKYINKKYGYEQGNNNIKDCSDLIADTFPDNSCFRIGGDEFAVIIKNKSNVNINLRIIEFEKAIKVHNKKYANEKINIIYGLATFDNKIDSSYYDVFIRADNSVSVKKQQIKLQED